MYMHTNSSLTIYNKYYDSEKGLDIYQKTYIDNINWDSIEGYIRNKTNLMSSDKVKIIIPKEGFTSDRQYLKPYEFKGVKDKSKYFTISSEDLIIEGPGKDINSPKDLGDHHVVTSVDYKNIGRSIMHYWLVMCK